MFPGDTANIDDEQPFEGGKGAGLAACLLSCFGKMNFVIDMAHLSSVVTTSETGISCIQYSWFKV